MKSNPIPLSGIDAPVVTVLLVTVRLPICAPAAVGANSTPAVQLNPGPSVAAQVLFTSWNPDGTASARPLRLVTVPELVTVTVVELLVWPTPVVAKLIVAGVTPIPAETAPVPLSVTLAGVAIEADVTVNVPVSVPVAVGSKTTPTVQLAPAARLVVQVFCVRPN